MSESFAATHPAVAAAGLLLLAAAGRAPRGCDARVWVRLATVYAGPVQRQRH